ncbi:MAG: hypothetical protein WC717_00935 [Candidatus Micrarchaeia archaeon]|jgi:hypothetical protein
MAIFLFQMTGFGSSHDPIEPYVKTLKNLEFMPPITLAEILNVRTALSEVEKKLASTDVNSTEGKHLRELLGRNLCSQIKDRKVTDYDVHLALLSLEAKAKDFKTSFAYSNTGFAQSLIGGLVTDASNKASVAQKDRIARG